MCFEVEVRNLHGGRFTLLLPFPNNWNYFIDAVARHEGVSRAAVRVVSGGGEIVYDYLLPCGQYVQFQVPWISISVRIVPVDFPLIPSPTPSRYG